MISHTSLVHIIGHTIQKYDQDLTDDLYIIPSIKLDQMCEEIAKLIESGEQDITRRANLIEHRQQNNRFDQLEKRVTNLETYIMETPDYDPTHWTRHDNTHETTTNSTTE